MDWQDLCHFMALASHGSFSAAAREMRVDHATVARRVAALERDLGLRLVDRLPRRAVLTPDGLRVAALAVGMGEAEQRIARYARSATTTLTATVRISAPPALAACVIAPAVAGFRAANPGITLVMSGLSGLAAMDRGEADLAVRLARPEDPDLVTRRIGLIRFALYVTPEWAALPPAEWQFIAYDPTLHHLSQEAWLRAFVAARPVVFEASDLFAQHAAARAGLGAALLPRFMGDADAGLIRTGPAPPTRDIWLLTYPDLRRAPAIRRAMDFLVEAVGRICPLLP